MAIQIIEVDPDGEESPLHWDTTFGIGFDDAFGDWMVADVAERLSVGGLRARAPIETAMALLLTTDARARPEDDLPDFVTDRRGWWGDKVDVDETIGEGDLGSRLWTLQWSPLDDDTLARAKALAREALQPLVTQRVVQRITVEGEALPAEGRIDLMVSAYGAVGSRPIARRFAVLWEAHASAGAQPLAR
jgi:phage gp46-like protein